MLLFFSVFFIVISGILPVVSDKTIDRKVCRSGLNGNTCVEEYDIKVRNCGAFRTYFLPQVRLSKSAYCFGKNK